MTAAFTRNDPVVSHADAYPRRQREAHAEQHILAMVAIKQLETPKSAEVANTYGIPDFVNHLKAMKAKFRNELSFGEGK
jgi:hypothetical protein